MPFKCFFTRLLSDILRLCVSICCFCIYMRQKLVSPRQPHGPVHINALDCLYRAPTEGVLKTYYIPSDDGEFIAMSAEIVFGPSANIRYFTNRTSVEYIIDPAAAVVIVKPFLSTELIERLDVDYDADVADFNDSPTLRKVPQSMLEHAERRRSDEQLFEHAPSPLVKCTFWAYGRDPEKFVNGEWTVAPYLDFDEAPATIKDAYNQYVVRSKDNATMAFDDCLQRWHSSKLTLSSNSVVCVAFRFCVGVAVLGGGRVAASLRRAADDGHGVDEGSRRRVAVRHEDRPNGRCRRASSAAQTRRRCDVARQDAHVAQCANIK
jgi:hypothetical protein